MQQSGPPGLIDGLGWGTSMTAMFSCSNCQRFIATDERQCPFCGQRQQMVTAHRALGMLAGLTLGLGGIACNPHPGTKNEGDASSTSDSAADDGSDTAQGDDSQGDDSQGDEVTPGDESDETSIVDESAEGDWGGGGSDYGGGDWSEDDEADWGGGGSDYGGGDWDDGSEYDDGAEYPGDDDSSDASESGGETAGDATETGTGDSAGTDTTEDTTSDSASSSGVDSDDWTESDDWSSVGAEYGGSDYGDPEAD